MGLCWSFVFVAPRLTVDTLLSALADHVTRGDRAGLLAALPWRPAQPQSASWATGRAGQGIRGLPFGPGSTPDVAFVLPLEAKVAAYQAKQRGRIEEGKAVIGAVYLRLSVGHEHAVLELSPASSDMSLLFAEPVVQQLATSIGAAGGATAAFFDLEDDQTWTLVFPPTTSWGGPTSVPRPAIRHPRDARETDDYGEQAIALARVQRDWRAAFAAADRAMSTMRAFVGEHPGHRIVETRSPSLVALPGTASSYEYFLHRYGSLTWLVDPSLALGTLRWFAIGTDRCLLQILSSKARDDRLDHIAVVLPDDAWTGPHGLRDAIRFHGAMHGGFVMDGRVHSSGEHPIYPFDIDDPTGSLPLDGELDPSIVVSRFGDWLEATVVAIIHALARP